MGIIHRGGCAFRKSVLLSRSLKREGKTKRLSTPYLWGSPLEMISPPVTHSHTEPPPMLLPSCTGKIHATQRAGGRALSVARSPGEGRAQEPRPQPPLGDLGKLSVHKPQKRQGGRQPRGETPQKPTAPHTAGPRVPLIPAF